MLFPVYIMKQKIKLILFKMEQQSVYTDLQINRMQKIEYSQKKTTHLNFGVFPSRAQKKHNTAQVLIKTSPNSPDNIYEDLLSHKISEKYATKYSKDHISERSSQKQAKDRQNSLEGQNCQRIFMHKKTRKNKDLQMSPINTIDKTQVNAQNYLTNSVRLSYQSMIIQQFMKRKKNKNRQFNNRDKFIAYSYGSTYEKNFLQHCHKLDQKQNYHLKQIEFRDPKQKDCLQRKQEKCKTFERSELQSMKILKIKKRIKIKDNMFQVKPMIPISKQYVKKTFIPNKICSEIINTETSDYTIASNQFPKSLKKKTYKIRKSNHSAASESVHSQSIPPEDSSQLQLQHSQMQLKCSSIKIQQLRKILRNEQKNQIRVSKTLATKFKAKQGKQDFEEDNLKITQDIKQKQKKVKLVPLQTFFKTNYSYEKNKNYSDNSKIDNVTKFLEKIKKLNLFIENYRQENNIEWSIRDRNTEKIAMKAFVGRGNNSVLFKQIIKRRWWWSLTNQKNSSKFIWTQLKDRLYYTNSSSNKALHNHILHNQQIGNKKSLYVNMRKYCQFIHQDPFRYLPVTFHIKEAQDKEYYRLVKYCQQNKHQIEQQKQLWIVKPGENTNRGHGITIVPNQEIITSIIQKLMNKGTPNLFKELKQQNKQQKEKKKRTFIIQKYIMFPLLYNNRKFDIRCYILITKINKNNYKFYWVKQGYIRTSSYHFDLTNFKNQFIHLTNDAVQLKSQIYGKYEDGNKISYQQLEDYIVKQCSIKTKKSVSFKQQIVPQMKQIGKKALIACLPQIEIQGGSKKPTFQLLGLDFMIDQNFKPYLIQINTNPCLETSCSVLKKIIPRLLDDTLKVTLDVICPPPALDNWSPNQYYLAYDIPEIFQEFETISEEIKQYKQFIIKQQNQNLETDNKKLEQPEDLEILKEES